MLAGVHLLLTRKVDIFVPLISKGNFLHLTIQYDVCYSILGEGVGNLIKRKDVISYSCFSKDFES